jgi:sterol 3beta-glucosyltransferase
LARSLITNLAGIPTIIKPFFGDQFLWADRVEALGVGSGVRKLTVAALTDALITATTDSKQINRAKLLGEQIRSVSLWWIPEILFSLVLCRRMASQLQLSQFIAI